MTRNPMSQSHVLVALLRDAYRPFAPVLHEIWLSVAPLLPDTLRDALLRLGDDISKTEKTTPSN